jgi:hypothetical protein
MQWGAATRPIKRSFRLASLIGCVTVHLTSILRYFHPALSAGKGGDKIASWTPSASRHTDKEQRFGPRAARQKQLSTADAFKGPYALQALKQSVTPLIATGFFAEAVAVADAVSRREMRSISCLLQLFEGSPRASLSLLVLWGEARNVGIAPRLSRRANMAMTRGPASRLALPLRQSMHRKSALFCNASICHTRFQTEIEVPPDGLCHYRSLYRR